MSDTPQPFFWIRRYGDTYIPLIPIDELPPWVTLKGVSTTKEWSDVCQGEMRFLGDHHDQIEGHYDVDIADEPGNSDESIGSSPTPTENHFGVDDIQANIDKITSGQDESRAASQTSHAEPSKYQGTAGTLGKKVYCTYWIRTGNCNYMQEGCKYKHEIPPDDETRLAIGVRTYPTWPREDPVSNPRPPPVKEWQGQKPANPQGWRYKDGKGGQAELPGLQDKSTHNNASQASSVASGPSKTQAAGSSPAPTSSTHHTAPIATVNANQHFPSHTNHKAQQQTHNKANAGVFTPSSGHPTSTTAGRPNGHPNHVQNPGIKSNFQHSQTSFHPLPIRLRNGTQATAQAQSTPYAQHAAPYPPQAGGQKNMDGARNSNEPSKYRIMQKLPNLDGPLDSFNFRSNTVQSASNPFNNTLATKPSARAPAHMGAGIIPGMAGQRLEFLARQASNNSSSRVNTPTSSKATIQTDVNSNTAHASSSDMSTASDVHINTPATVSSHTGVPDHTTFTNSQAFDPAIISVRTQTPLSNTSRGPLLPNTYMQQNVSAEVPQAPFSPPTFHRRMFRQPGEPEFVANPQEETQPKPQRSGRRPTSGSVTSKGKRNGHAAKRHDENHTRDNSGDSLI